MDPSGLDRGSRVMAWREMKLAGSQLGAPGGDTPLSSWDGRFLARQLAKTMRLWRCLQRNTG
ncbi:hypothetical protein Tdes44962_MAKER10361, partial [Teratosphaeria destructans]